MQISVSALQHNLGVARGRFKHVCAAVKAEAYGHGLVEVARVFEQQKADFLAVALIEEGVVLREAGVTCPVWVIGGALHGGYKAAVEHGLTLAVSLPEHVQGLAEAAQGRQVLCHLEIDTGMARLGASLQEVHHVLDVCAQHPHVVLDGVYTHLACADAVHATVSVEEQNALFTQACALLKTRGFAPRWHHMVNSAGVLMHPSYGTHVARPGLMLYGIDPSESGAFRSVLKPAMRWCTKPVMFRDVPKGTRVSYGGWWQAQRPTRLATLPVGYADGYRRIYGKKGAYVLVGGKKAPVVGTVCMDLCMVDVTGIEGLSYMSEVVLLGKQGEEEISVYEMASWSDTIPYEVTCAVGARVPRVYVP